ncbi:MAG: SDR family NAD(P)-dependent oxidoreductase [Chloroflexi bacterium]|nr:SDR family NAD(P)-dependent oxidoreductase [Chloroflexota bacterium]
MDSPRGRVAVVTGASRGGGRGIALALGDAGATVYVSGRSTRGAPTTEGLPGTVEETAEAVTARGGRGIPVVCDHTADNQVAVLFARVHLEQGRLDLLVNNVWGGYERYESEAAFGVPFWQQPPRHWHGMFEAGLRAHLLASQHAAPLLVDQRRGLIVSTVAWDRGKYLGNLFYDVAKAAIVRLVFGMARELREHGVAVVAVAPGFMRTERVVAVVGEAPEFDWSQTESPEYVGRAVAALAADPNVLDKSGQVLAVGDLAREYGFVDVDGRQVPSFHLPDD